MDMEGISGTTRIAMSGDLLHGDASHTTTEFSPFIVHDKPPPSYEESQRRQQQQHQEEFRCEAVEVSQADKCAIYRHPLFPLLAMLFDKCEWATGSQEGPNGQAFQNDIRSFLLHLGQDGKSLMSGNDETDSLMVKAILVLKIHLLEIEKVNELCKDFCQRYIACLKGKLQTDNMLGIFSSGFDSYNSSLPDHANVQLNQLQEMSSMSYLGQSTSSNTTAKGNTPLLKNLNSHVPSLVQSTSLPTVSNSATNSEQSGSVISSSIANSVYESSLPAIDAQYKSPVSGTTNQSLRTVPLSDYSPPPITRKQSRRSVLPKHATNTMKAWLFQHIAHPYPSEEEKRILARQTDLSMLQVNNWFINARRRILQPMLDSSNPDNGMRSRKVKTNPTRVAQRFWPESLVQSIQGCSSSIQFPQQAVHILSNDLKDGPITVVSSTNPLASTGVPIQCVQADKLPILTMLPCPTQTIDQTHLVAVTNDIGNVNPETTAVSLTSGIVVSDPSKLNNASSPDEDLAPVSQLQVTASQIPRTFQ